jgi:hypothetical protein
MELFAPELGDEFVQTGRPCRRSTSGWDVRRRHQPRLAGGSQREINPVGWRYENRIRSVGGA